MAQRSGLSPEAIRYYEHIGVLTEPARTPGGYRDYGEDILDRLGFIRGAQGVGLTLGQIREIIAFRDGGQAPCAHVLGLIHQRRAQLSERIAELERMRTELDHLAVRARSLRPEECSEAAICHVIPSHLNADGRGGGHRRRTEPRRG